jgi:hypothetical protein
LTAGSLNCVEDEPEVPLLRLDVLPVALPLVELEGLDDIDEPADVDGELEDVDGELELDDVDGELDDVDEEPDDVDGLDADGDELLGDALLLPLLPLVCANANVDRDAAAAITVKRRKK